MNKESRTSSFENAEKLRQKNVARKRTYSEQLALEKRAFIDGMADFARSMQKRFLAADFEFWEYFAVLGFEQYFREWRSLIGKSSDWEGIGGFFTSDHFYALPVPKITAQLNAKLVTDSRKIEPGDGMDVKHLSAAIPMAHFLLTDRKTSLRIKDLGIDTEWQTSVYCESSIEELIEELKNCSQRSVASVSQSGSS